jgi:hypothetical protein
MIKVREATGRDVPEIQQIFLATYGTDYNDPRYYDEPLLTRLVYSESSLMLVAEDTELGRVVGTASLRPALRPRPAWCGEGSAWPRFPSSPGHPIRQRPPPSRKSRSPC